MGVRLASCTAAWNTRNDNLSDTYAEQKDTLIFFTKVTRWKIHAEISKIHHRSGSSIRHKFLYNLTNLLWVSSKSGNIAMH